MTCRSTPRGSAGRRSDSAHRDMIAGAAFSLLDLVGITVSITTNSSMEGDPYEHGGRQIF